MEFIKPLWAHQLRALNEAIQVYEETPADQQSGYALFMDPRTGKSAVAVNMLRYLCNKKMSRFRTLIFCPPRIIPGWKTEILAHSKISAAAVIPLLGSGAKRERLFEDGVAQGAHVFIANYESLRMEGLFALFQEWKPEMIIFDESHRLKEPSSKQSKFAEKLANPREKVGAQKLIRNAPYKMILSGSPVLNSPRDIYNQFRILDGGQTFSYYDYRTGKNEPLSLDGFMRRYFTDRNSGMPAQSYFPKWELKTQERDAFDAMGEISQLIAKKSIRVERKDCFDLPPTSRVVIETSLSPEQKRLYAEMKKNFITMHKEKAVVASMALTQTLRLLQICSGFVKTDEGKEVLLDDVPKRDALRELLEELLPSGKCIVWSVFHADYESIRSVCEKLKVGYAEVHGLVSGPMQQKNIERFKRDPECKVFIGAPGSAGEGLNLVEAAYNIFYSRTHSLGHSIQASARNQSADSTHDKTVRYDIVAMGTLDELVAEVVVGKEKMAQGVYAELVLKNLLQSEIF